VPAATALTTAALVGFPLAAALITLVVMFHSALHEPYGVFSIGDAVVQVGGPFAAIVPWPLWFWLAWIKRRLPWPVLVPVACWATLNVLVALSFVVSYFHDPWTW